MFSVNHLFIFGYIPDSHTFAYKSDLVSLIYLHVLLFVFLRGNLEETNMDTGRTFDKDKKKSKFRLFAHFSRKKDKT